MMHSFGERLLRSANAVGAWVNRHALAVLLAIAGVFVLFFSTLAVLKFARFGYNGLDLAIYSQVFHESLRGNLFGLTIHPHPYLGDHVELILLGLLPFFALAQSPQTLLVLQVIALAAGAPLLYAIARLSLPKTASLAVALGYLFYPAIQNIALFEFHALPFAIPLLLATVYAYLRKRFGLFLLFAGLALTVREDVSLVIAGIGVVALLDRRRWYWWALPFALGAAWFVGSLRLTASFSAYGQYKFLRYYAWLGDSAAEIFRNFFLHPLRWLERLWSVRAVELLVGAFLPILFLPFARPKWLLPTLPIFLQLLLLSAPGEILLQIHYPALLIPFLFIALTAALAALWHGQARTKLMRALTRWRVGLAAFVPLAALYFAIVLGPLWDAPRQIARGVDREDIALQDAFVRLVPEEAALATTFAPLQKTAERQRVYSLSYVFLGRKQFSEEPYELPGDADMLLIDLDDLIRFDLLYPDNTYQGRRGYERLRGVLGRGFSLVAWEDHLTLWKRNGNATLPLLETFPAPKVPNGSVALGQTVALLGATGADGASTLTPVPARVGETELTVLPVALSFSVKEKIEQNAELAFRLYRAGSLAYEKFYPVASGLLPTSAWEPGETVTMRYRFRLPRTLPPGAYEVRIALVDLKAHVDVDGLRSIAYNERIAETLGAEASLGSVAVPTRDGR